MLLRIPGAQRFDGGLRLGFQVGAMACVIVVATATILVVRGRAAGQQNERLAFAQLSAAVNTESSLAATALADGRFPPSARAERARLRMQVAAAITELGRRGHAGGPKSIVSAALRFDDAAARVLSAVALGDLDGARQIDANEIDAVVTTFNRDLAFEAGKASRSARAQSRIADVFSLAIALLAAAGLAWLARRILKIERRVAREAAMDAASRDREAEMQQAQRMDSVGRLAAGVAHDFNNLLTGVIGYASLVLGRLAPEDTNRPALEQILGAAHRAADLTRQLLAFGRRQDMVITELDCGAVLGEMRGLLAGVVREDVALSYDIGESVSVRGDANQLEHVILNLVVNAQDAMPFGGKIDVSLSRVELESDLLRRDERLPPGSYALVSVTDDGTGMNEATLSQIFEPYFTTKGDHGHGLGLPTAAGIVAQSGGLMDARSEDGAGTTFDIYLPAISPRSTLVPPSARPALLTAA